MATATVSKERVRKRKGRKVVESIDRNQLTAKGGDLLRKMLVAGAEQMETEEDCEAIRAALEVVCLAEENQQTVVDTETEALQQLQATKMELMMRLAECEANDNEEMPN